MFFMGLPSAPKNRRRILLPRPSYSDTELLGLPWSGSMDLAISGFNPIVRSRIVGDAGSLTPHPATP